MADNPTIDNGALTDYAVSADEGSGGYVQRVKLTYSADGSETHVAADADGLLVNLGANNDVTVTGTVTASDGGGTLTVDDGGSSLTVDGSVSITGSVAVTDNSGSLTVDNAGTFAVQAAQSGTWTVQPGNTANTVAWKVDGSAVTQPVSIAAAVPVTDNSGSLTVDDGASSLTVDAPVGTPVFVRLSDGSSAITTLPVSLASVPSHAVTNVGTFAVQDSEKIADNAGFTDGTTKVLPTGYVYDEVAGTSLTENDIAAARIDAKRAQVLVFEDATTRGQRAAVSAAGRLSVDASGVAVPVTDNSGSLTVDNAGTFAVQAAQSGTWNITNVSGTVSLPTGAATAAKQPALGTAGTPSADVITVQGITSMTALKVDGSAVTQPVSGTVAVSGTVTVGSHAVTNAGTFAVQESGAALTSLQLIDDVVFAEDAAHTTGDKGVMALAVRKDTPVALAGTDGDYTPAITDALGATWTRNLPATSASVSAVADAATNQTLLTASTTRKGFRIQNDSDQVLYVKYGTTATTTDFTSYLLPGAVLFEDNYNGNVDGIWAANSSGSARVTSLS